ncbi:MAG: hypothetical protein IPK83_06195 [Planctomycetes bacterium]|nr:hypothetical protein [Planctomycetota bacterium]
MLTFELRRRIFWGLVWSFLAFAVVGCQSTIPAPRTRSAINMVEPAASIQTPHSPKSTLAPNRVDAGVTDNSGDGADSRDNAFVPRERPSIKTPPTSKPPLKKKKFEDDEERHPSKWRQKLKAKYA